ncbi:MAG: aminotransferase class IV family protein [Robiginitomaculum sp.]|nr:aminotransferase class IV family protein [Robiginitomaculum sp.]
MAVEEIVWINGVFCTAKDIVWPLSDRGLSLGDGLFETICLQNGSPRFFPAHWQRLRNSSTELLFDDIGNGEEVLLALQELIIRNQIKEGSIRILLSRGVAPRGIDIPQPAQSNLLLRVFPKPTTTKQPLHLALSKVRRVSGNPTSSHKTLSNMDMVMSRRFLVAGAKGNESLLLDNEGHLSCAGTANLFWIKGDDIYTSSISCAVLSGITRARILQEFGNIKTGEYFPKVLRSADMVFISNAVIGVKVVQQIDLGDNEILQFAGEHSQFNKIIHFMKSA